jgi:hypothetical protein
MSITLGRAGCLQEMEIGEVKFGFIPNSQDQQAWRFRRRYRLIKGTPCPQLVLVHYTRGQAARACVHLWLLNSHNRLQSGQTWARRN